MNKIQTLITKIKSVKGKHEFKNPWIPIFINWFVVLAFVVLVIGTVIHGIQVHIERRVNTLTAIALAEYQEQERAKEQEQEALLYIAANAESQRKQEDTMLLAKMLTGISKFVDQYGYSDGDLRTYAECAINRVYNNGNGFADTLSEVIKQPNQWTGFSEDNQVIDRYYRIAEEVVNNFYNHETRPCSSDFCWAELRRNGIWLKNEFSDSPYVLTWRYQG